MIILIVVLAVIALWAISVQRKLVSLDEFVKNSMSQIGVQMNSRWDALKSLAELVQSYDKHEYQTLMDVIASRKTLTRESSAGEVASQESSFASAFKSINVVAEQYPELKASEMFKTAMNSVNTYENQVRMSRMTYNDAVTKLNRAVRSFPDSVLAGMFGFSVKEYLAEPEGKTEMPSMKF